MDHESVSTIYLILECLVYMVCVACILHPNLRDDLYFAKEQAIESCCTKTVTRPCIWLDRLSWNTQDMYSRTSALSLQSDNNQNAIFYEKLDARKLVDLVGIFHEFPLHTIIYQMKKFVWGPCTKKLIQCVCVRGQADSRNLRVVFKVYLEEETWSTVNRELSVSHNLRLQMNRRIDVLSRLSILFST